MSLVSLADEPVFQITIPSKTQFLLSAGIPVLAVAPGEVGALVESAGAGLAAPPGDPAALARALTKAAAMSDQDLQAMATRATGPSMAVVDFFASVAFMVAFLPVVLRGFDGLPCVRPQALRAAVLLLRRVVPR